MKIISSFMDDLFIQKGMFHSITFKSSYIQSQFRKLILAYFQNEIPSDYCYLNVLSDNGNEVQYKDFYFMSFDCNIINLKEEKGTTKLLQDLLYYHLENNPDLIQDYMKFNEQINEFISRIEMVSDDLIIDFQPTEKTISQFIKSLHISLEYNESDYVPNTVLRKFLIESLLKMNITEKDVFLLISYPETDIGSEDFEEFIKILKQLQITTIIISAQPDFLTAAEEGNMFLVDKNGSVYDTIKLKNELLTFDLVNQENSWDYAKTLAFRDFNEDYFLLDRETKEFLQSNKF